MNKLEERRNDNLSRLQELTARLDFISEYPCVDDLCIYITGSYGRLEASKNSDLDLFFIHEGEKEKNLPKIQKILIDAEIIKIAKELKYPEFSNDGQYLEIHSLKDIKEKMGCPDDDFKNYFTARLLLLLESRVKSQKLCKKISPC